MENLTHDQSRLLALILEHIDIPKSYYEKAAARHRSLCEWLQRPESKLADFAPDIRPQGSFRYGTVTRPIRKGEAYDLDNVCLLVKLTKTVLTQEQLKHMYGEEIKAYARANNMNSPVTEHNRCWRLHYADEVEFHLDTLPCVPEEAAIVQRIIAAGVEPELARRAVAITDKRHPSYRQLTSAWPSSNPRGFAAFFEQQAVLGLRRAIAEGRFRAAIEDVPPYEWKTTLQRSIQILKRHRDVMFIDDAELAPISMIITNLAAQAYEGQTDLALALHNILEKMPDFVRPQRPRVPNPADPAEDYADKWSQDPRLEKCFWDWHTAAKADLARLIPQSRRSSLNDYMKNTFRVDLSQEELREFEAKTPSSPTTITKAAPVVLSSAAKPWSDHV